MKRITISNQVLVQEMGDEAVLLELDSEQYFGLDGVGLRVWQCIVEYGDLDPVLKVLANEYNVDETTLRCDLEALLAQLLEAGLVKVENR